MLMDALNWKILKCLQENARHSNAKIGRIVGISSPAVSERIKKMDLVAPDHHTAKRMLQ